MPVASDADRQKVLAYSNREVVVALGFAGLVNLAMMAMAAAVFHGGHDDVASIDVAYRTLVPLLGGAAATIFMVSLIASGVSSSVVGTLAGQSIMQDFVSFRIPVWVRRLVTMVPSFGVIAIGVEPTNALVISQVVLSLVLPIPMVTLIWFTGQAEVMGQFANARWLSVVAAAAAVLVLALNGLLLAELAGLA